MSFFDHPLLRRCPAVVALEKIEEPKPEHIRACILELARLIIRQAEEKPKEGKKEGEET